MSEMMIPDEIDAESEQAVHNYNRIFYGCLKRQHNNKEYPFNKKDYLITQICDYDYTDYELTCLNKGIDYMFAYDDTYKYEHIEYLIKFKNYLNPEILVYILLALGKKISQTDYNVTCRAKIRLYLNVVFMEKIDNAITALKIIDSSNQVSSCFELFNKDVYDTYCLGAPIPIPIRKQPFDPASYNDMSTYDEQLLTLFQIPYTGYINFSNNAELMYAIIDYMTKNHKYMSIDELRKINNSDECFDYEMFTTCHNFVNNYKINNSRQGSSIKQWYRFLSKIDRSSEGITASYLVHLWKIINLLIDIKGDIYISEYELYSMMKTISELGPDYPSEFIIQMLICNHEMRTGASDK